MWSRSDCCFCFFPFLFDFSEPVTLRCCHACRRLPGSLADVLPTLCQACNTSIESGLEEAAPALFDELILSNDNQQRAYGVYYVKKDAPCEIKFFREGFCRDKLRAVSRRCCAFGPAVSGHCEARGSSCKRARVGRPKFEAIVKFPTLLSTLEEIA